MRPKRFIASSKAALASAATEARVVLSSAWRYLLIDQEAKRRSLDRAILYEQEITSKVKPVVEADIAAWFQANQQRVVAQPPIAAVPRGARDAIPGSVG